ncbi:hypothetical protein HBI18_045880 [Parastagonospora nodorum]|nr:hypothetical protein HBH61_070040 [Parastagonospora nodorum]KAH4920530.1 hypothetical protein HBH74_129880 [Parastagonospora nodorum]KAH4939758.1 hypothetical protein HBH73_163590 [Parastagonospora nodorum]KAH4985051.1 hypothetical protein HBI76_129140 [Parastagonospora nodorum]KAH5061397.1 hypothetical protein HBH96_075490 [Parastagonospora nodorum]
MTVIFLGGGAVCHASHPWRTADRSCIQACNTGLSRTRISALDTDCMTAIVQYLEILQYPMRLSGLRSQLITGAIAICGCDAF